MRSDNRYKFLYFTAFALLIAYAVLSWIPSINTEENKIYIKILFLLFWVLLLIYHFLKPKKNKEDID